jgi:hypothetical protein
MTLGRFESDAVQESDHNIVQIINKWMEDLRRSTKNRVVAIVQSNIEWIFPFTGEKTRKSAKNSYISRAHIPHRIVQLQLRIKVK